MKVNNLIVYLLFGSIFFSIQTKVVMRTALPVSDNQIQESVQQIVKEAQSLLDIAKDRLLKLCEGSYAKDRWTFKDFVWAFDGLAMGLNDKVLYPLRVLKSNISGNSSWVKVLSLIQSVADEFHKRLSSLSKDLRPYERTKNVTHNYRIAKIFESHVNGILTCIDKVKADLNEAIFILQDIFNSEALIVSELTEFKKSFENLIFAGKGDIGFVSRLVGRIKNN
jgi:hypothetical protein